MAIGLPTAPAPPAAPAPSLLKIAKTYLGNDLYASFDGRYVTLVMPCGSIMLARPAMEALNQFTQAVLQNNGPRAEASVWCEEKKKHYRAVLIREMTQDEIYAELK